MKALLNRYYIQSCVPLLFLLLALSSSQHCQAQDSPGPVSYCTAAIGGGTHFFVRVAADVFIKDKNSVGGTFLYETRLTHGAPGDFNTYNAGFLSNEARPFDKYTLFAATYGRVFYGPSPESLRFNIKMGPVLGTLNRAENYVFVPDPNPGWLFNDDKYTYQMVKHPVYGFLLNPVMEVTGRKYMGFSVGAHVLMTNYDVLGGIDVGIAFGKVRFRRGYYRDKKM